MAYSGAKADTRRSLPSAGLAIGHYDFNGWVSEVSVHYTLTAGNWRSPRASRITYLRTMRKWLVEAGEPFALTIARLARGGLRRRRFQFCAERSIRGVAAAVR